MNPRQRKCYDLVRQELAPGASVLELSCGKGEILCALHADGYSVCGTNFSKYALPATTIPIRAGVDIRKRLPFDDESFDGVVLCDVIEHVSDQPALMTEMSRVLKTNGIVVVLTPNTNRINSRVHFLLTGFLKIKRAFIGFDVPSENAFAFHNYPPHLPVFLYQMHSCRLNMRRFDACGLKVKSIIMWAPLAPFIHTATFINIYWTEKYLRKFDSRRFLYKTLTSFKALCGEYWVTVHRKGSPSESAQAGSTRLPSWHERAEADTRDK